MPELTEEQIQQYETWGYVRVPAAFPPCAARDMADFIWARLRELHGVRQEDPTTWCAPAPWAGLKRFKDDAVFRPLGGPSTTAAIDELLGRGQWRRPRTWGGFLIKFPDRPLEQWELPASHWHVDFHFTHDPRTRFGVRVFSYLSEVRPRGGATLVVSGSHRLVERFVSSLPPQVRTEDFPVLRDRFNSSDPWLAKLTGERHGAGSRIALFMESAHKIQGISVRVEELCAEPGDVVLMHPWLLHAASPNALDQPRFTIAKDVFSELASRNVRESRGAATADFPESKFC